MRTILHENEKRPVVIAGKGYHWKLVNGVLTLVAGWEHEDDEFRYKVRTDMLNAGMPPELVTEEMVESVLTEAKRQHQLALDGTTDEETGS